MTGVQPWPTGPARAQKVSAPPVVVRPGQALTSSGLANDVPGMRVRISHIPGLTQADILDHNVPWHFQCPPLDPFTITRGHDSQEYETIVDGAFSTNAAAKLDIIQFKALFVEEDDEWVLFWQYDVDHAKDLLRRLSKTGTPVHLMCGHKHGFKPEYDGPVTLTDYVHTENEPFAYYTDVTFKEYRDPVVDGLIHKRRGGRSWPKQVKLKATDTLYSLAKHYYGKASVARHIANANHIRTTNFNESIVKLGGKWHVGATITLPAPPAPKPIRTRSPTTTG